MIIYEKYSSTSEEQWNSFIRNSKNGTFMLERGYMDYHSDRFIDNSLMFFDEKDRLIAVMPASLHGNELRSHGGLTYGGMITNKKMTQQCMLELFDCLRDYMKIERICRLLYKRVPSIYYAYPSDEDLYALFINNAKLVRRDISTAIEQVSKIPFSKGKKYGVNRAKRNGVWVKEFFDFDIFFKYENCLLQKKYNVSAVHTADEMRMLAERFPGNIRMFGGFLGEEFLAGTIVFSTKVVAHTQYITTTEKGRDLAGIELVFDYLIKSVYSDVEYFDFGISTENGGRVLNEGLIRQKEMFGGRSIAYDFYELSA